MSKERIRTFQEECSGLAQLQTFDPSVFQADERTPQNLCNFVLSLALIHNDCRDTIYAHILLQNSKPDGQFRVSRIWGSYYGIEWRIFRLVVSHLHELFKLIREQSEILSHPFLQKVIKQLRSKARDDWRTLVKVALGSTPKDEFGRALLQVRNTIASHYDPKAIFKGYSQHFLGQDKVQDRAYISRGLSMSESRFYFADAVVPGYLQTVVGRDKSDDLQLKVIGLLDPLNFALMGIVDGFIQKRGFAYRAASE